MSNQVLTAEDVFKREYQLDVPDLFEYPADKTLKLITSCANNSEIRTLNVTSTGTSEFNFSTTFATDQFLSTCMKINMRIPFTVTLAAWPKDDKGANIDITQDNLIQHAFNKGAAIAFAQQAADQGILTESISLNDNTLEIVNDVAELSNITSPYWDSRETSEYIQASVPDQFQSYADYKTNAATGGSLKFLDDYGKAASISMSPDNQYDPFASKLTSGKYNSRTPHWTYISSDATAKTIKVSCNFWTYPRFSIGTTPNAETSIPGVRKLDFTLRLAPDFGKRVFALNGAHITSVDQDISDTAGTHTNANLMIKLLSPPEYVREVMYDKETGRLKPYSMSIPRIKMSKHLAMTVEPYGSSDFYQDNIDMGSIPRSIYIALVRERNADPIRTPVSFGLVSNLTVQVTSSTSNFSSQLSLKHLAQSNGYDELDALGMLTKGYPIKINLAKDLNLPASSVVGGAGSYTLSVRGTMANQGSAKSTYHLSVVVVSEGTLDFDGERFHATQGVWVPTALLSNKFFLHDLYHKNMKQVQVLGAGKFTDAMKWVTRNVHRLASTAWNNRDNIASTVGDVMNLAKTLRGGKLDTGNVSGGKGSVTLGAGAVRNSIFK